MGAKKAPFYRVVVADERYPRDGRFIEEIGYYDPMANPAVIKIDGELAEVSSEGESYYSDSETEKISFDFSLYYNSFNHLGDGVYYAKALLIADEEAELEFTDVTVIISEDKVTSIAYKMEIIGMECEFEYTFSMWGQASVETPTLSEEEFSAALDLSNYDNYTMDVSVFDMDGNFTSTIYYFNGNACHYVIYTEDGDSNDFHENIDSAGVVKNEYIGMLAELSAVDFVYDSFSGMYTYIEGEECLAIAIEDGFLVYIAYVDEIGNEHSAYLYDYGMTVIE